MNSSSRMIHLNSLESTSLVGVLLLFFWDFLSHYDFSTEFLQLKTFDQLVSSINYCNYTKGPDDPPSHLRGFGGTTVKANNPTCPIDRDRLRYLDDSDLDTWLNYRHIKLGGHFEPIGCSPRQRIAIIVPCREKQEHLDKFLLYMHQFLPDQLIDYKIIVVEQANPVTFNEMKLINIGVAKVMRSDPDISCFIFHDADLLPLDQRNLYMCSRWPRHLSTSISAHRYHLIYSHFGGVISMAKNQYNQIGGLPEIATTYSNSGEDILQRIIESGLSVERSPSEYGLYIATSNQWGKQNQASDKLPNNPSSLLVISESKNDLSNKESIEIDLTQLYTHIKVHI